jgi:hypothetical protein
VNCPPDVAEIVLQIIKTAVLRIRHWGWSDNPGRCALEADHVHNLPDLLARFSSDLLKYYWDVERPSFISQSSPADVAQFEPLWEKLEGHVHGLTGPVRHPA